jgi:hypothetical protein
MERLISETGHFDVQSDIVGHYNERKSEVNRQIDTQLTLLKKKKNLKKESKKSEIRFLSPFITRVFTYFNI